jgi:hypothetical protein
MKHLENVICGGGGVETYRHNSAQAKCKAKPDGLWLVDYRGPLCNTSALVLGRLVTMHTRGARATIERTDKALIVMTGSVLSNSFDYLIGSPPGCIICADEAWEQTHEFCRVLARIGVIRVAFRPDELADAFEFSAALLHA